MVRIDKAYTFAGPDGEVGLLDLFEGRVQLIMHHFMWIYDVGPGGTETPPTMAARAAPPPPTGSASCGSCTSAAPRFRQ